MPESAEKIAKRARLSYLAAAFFFLAGLVTGADAVMGHHRTLVPLGSMWFALGALWTLVGNRFYRRAAALRKVS